MASSCSKDSCEALGSSYRGAKFGTHRIAGSFNSYYEHHISTIEGGIVITDDDDQHQIHAVPA